ncbi:oxidoreductase [Bacillus sp. REN10]|uniref:oxidoreductase n=1 Tax=Bacillus sp. REN10 TaxID=2782541 RepID=UPI00193BC580|nr:oxidoreductase [Bacillus sp. REN10]
MGKIALVAGATGLVGMKLVQQLLAAPEYEKVITLVRRASGMAHDKLEEQVVHFDSLNQLMLDGRVDHAFCCLGTTIKKAKTKEAFRVVDLDYPLRLAQLAKRHHASQFLVISSMGASVASPFFYSRVKGELEQRLQTLELNGLHLFRPSLLLGERSDFRFGEAAAEKFFQAFPFLFAGPMKKYKPIHAETVARAMVAAALTEKSGVHIYESDQIDEKRVCPKSGRNRS